MSKKFNKLKKLIIGLFCGILMIFGTMNVLIFSAPVVNAENIGTEIHFEE